MGGGEQRYDIGIILYTNFVLQRQGDSGRDPWVVSDEGWKGSTRNRGLREK